LQGNKKKKKRKKRKKTKKKIFHGVARFGREPDGE